MAVLQVFTRLSLWLATAHPALYWLALLFLATSITIGLCWFFSLLLTKNQLSFKHLLLLSLTSSSIVLIVVSAVFVTPYILGDLSFQHVSNSMQTAVWSLLLRGFGQKFGVVGLPLLLLGISFVFIFVLQWFLLRTARKDFSEEVKWSTDLLAFLFAVGTSILSTGVIFSSFLSGQWLVDRCDQIVVQEFHHFNEYLISSCLESEKLDSCPLHENSLRQFAPDRYASLQTCGRTIYEVNEETGVYTWIFTQNQKVWISSPSEPRGYGYYVVYPQDRPPTSETETPSFPPDYDGPWDKVW